MNAIGLIETIGYVAAIEASDACVKSANVNIVSIDKVGAGIVTLTICGDVGAVKSAVEAGEMAAQRVGTLRSSHVIPRMHNEVVDVLLKKEEPNVCNKCNDLNNNSEYTLEVTFNASEEGSNENNENANEAIDKSLYENINEEIEDSNINEVEALEQLEIYNEIENTEIDKDNLSKYSVKELKAIVKKLDNSITHKELNALKKEDLINLVKRIIGEDR